MDTEHGHEFEFEVDATSVRHIRALRETAASTARPNWIMAEALMGLSLTELSKLFARSLTDRREAWQQRWALTLHMACSMKSIREHERKAGRAI